MKIKNLFAMVLASVVLVACSDSKDDDNGVVKDPKGKAWLSLSIKNPSGTQLRSLNSPDTDTGTSDETVVKAVRAIFFDGSNAVVDDIVLSPAEAGSPGQPTGSSGEGFEVNAAAKYVMIIVNPPSGLTATFGTGDDYATVVNAALSLTVDKVTNPATDGFMMTNAKGDLEPSLPDGTLTPLTLYTTKALAETAPLSINVDRVVAKVRLYTNGFTKPSGITVSNIEWVLNVTNKKFFPLSARVHTFLDTSTPFDQYGLGSFRKDPNYDHATDGATFPGTGYDNSYNYYDDVTSPAPGDWLQPTDGGGTAQYCHENTQQQADNSYAYVTHMIVKAEYRPDNFVNVDSTLTTSTAGGDWMRISGRMYNFTSLMTYIKRELTRKYAATDPTTMATPLSNALNNYLDSVGLSINKVAIPPTGVPGDETAVYNAFNALQTTIEGNANKAGTFGSFAYYASGLNYYRIAIKHDDTGGATNELGEFGVVRNSVYDVKIKSINNPGLPAIPEPDPTDPVESDGSWLSVEININPWTWYVQEEDL